MSEAGAALLNNVIKSDKNLRKSIQTSLKSRKITKQNTLSKKMNLFSSIATVSTNSTLIKKLNLMQLENDGSHIATDLIKMAEKTYHVLSYLVDSKIFPNQLLKPYANLLISHVT